MPHSKAGYYQESNVPSTVRFGYWLDQHDLEKENLDWRTAEFIDFAVKRWPVP
jgi:hypothetical protein